MAKEVWIIVDTAGQPIPNGGQTYETEWKARDAISNTTWYRNYKPLKVLWWKIKKHPSNSVFWK